MGNRPFSDNECANVCVGTKTRFNRYFAPQYRPTSPAGVAGNEYLSRIHTRGVKDASKLSCIVVSETVYSTENGPVGARIPQ